MILETLKLNLPLVVLEDVVDSNIHKIILQTIIESENVSIHFHCYEQPPDKWKSITKGHHMVYHDHTNTESKQGGLIESSYTTDGNSKFMILIDSINELALRVGWQQCMKILTNFIKNSSVIKVVVVLHVDCLPYGLKMKTHLEHIAALNIQVQKCDVSGNLQISMKLKKGGKLIKHTEDIYFDRAIMKLSSSPVLKKKEEVKSADENVPLPHSVASFKIGLEEGEKEARDNLELPYMQAGRLGESRVFYEHDAADDWDDEDPDEDLDI